MPVTRAELLAAVERSPAAAHAHDRAGWIALFTDDACVEYPVGSTPHCGRRGIERYYDTFIGPRDVTFHPDVDVVAGPTVIRDLELEVTMPPGLVLRIPAYLRYDLRPERGELKITRLQAYWEMPSTLGQFVRGGMGGLPAGARLTLGLLRHQGLAGAAGFVGGLRGVGAAGKRDFADFLDRACAGDEIAARRRLAGGPAITSGDDGRLGRSGLIERLAGSRPHKLIGSGHSLVAAIERAGRRDILIAEVEPKPFTITRIRYFAATGPDDV